MLELRRISAGYAGDPVLRDVDLTVPDGAVVALIGPNGAGKTTLLRVASGLLRPTSGSVLLDDRDVTGWDAAKRSSAGMCHVPEGRGVFATMTVRDNLRLQAPVGEDRAARETAAAVFPRLGERLAQTAGTMSGGEQQMLALAHAYVSHPSVVLLDELSMGLAPVIVSEIFDHLHQLAEEGVSMLIVEQYVTHALQLADYVYVLRKGRIAFVGEPDELSDDDIMGAYMGRDE